MIRILFALCVGFAAGCTRTPDDDRVNLSGKVTFKGQPIPSGEILFDPDSSRGNSGMQGSAEIVDGHYQTLPKFGPGPGPYIARVSGYRSKNPSDSDREVNLDGKAICLNVGVPVTIDPSMEELDIDVQSAD